MRFSVRKFAVCLVYYYYYNNIIIISPKRIFKKGTRGLLYNEYIYANRMPWPKTIKRYYYSLD